MKRVGFIQRWRRSGAYGAVAVVFVLAQVFGGIHAAKYGGDFHEHDGTPCAVQFVTETFKALSAPSAPTVPPPLFADYLRPFWACKLNNVPFVSASRFIRGPPLSRPILRAQPALT